MKFIGALLLLAIASLAVPSCKSLGITGAKVVNCGSDAITERGLSYVGRVNDILSDAGTSDGSANMNLVQLGIDIGQDVVGCILRDQATKFAESSHGNPDDKVSLRAMTRANHHLQDLESKGWRFQ